jgi:hypothetical protein
MQSSEILFLLVYTPKKNPLFTLWRLETSLGLLLVCPYVRRGGQKITVTALNHRPLSCCWSFVFLEKYLIVTNIIFTRVASFDSSYSTSSMAPSLASCIYGPLFLYRTSHFGLAAQC